MCAKSEARLLAFTSAAAAATAGRHQLPNQFSGTASVPRKFEVAVETELEVTYFFLPFFLFNESEVSDALYVC